MAENLTTYLQGLETAFAEKLPYAAYNKDMAHAKLVVCTAMSHAEREVCLLSERLDPILYASSWFLTAARQFLDRGGRLRVLVETEIPPGHPVLQLDKEYERFEIRRVPELLDGRYKFNFMLIDDIGYRFEPDRREPRAMVNLYDSDKTMLVDSKRMFDMMWNDPV